MNPMRFRDYVWPQNPETVTVARKKELGSYRVPGVGNVVQDLGCTGCAPSADTVRSVSNRLSALREINVAVSVQAASAVPVDVSATVKAAPGVSALDAQTACAGSSQCASPCQG